MSRKTAESETTVRTISDCTVAPTASFMERSTRPHQVKKAQMAARGASHRGTSGMSQLPTRGTCMAPAMSRLMTAMSRQSRM